MHPGAVPTSINNRNSHRKTAAGQIGDERYEPQLVKNWHIRNEVYA